MRVALIALATSVIALALALYAIVSSRAVPAPASGTAHSVAPASSLASEPEPTALPPPVAAQPVSSAVVPPGPYRAFVAPPAVTVRRSDDAGTFVVETTDRAVAGTTVQIFAERTDGTTESLSIALPAAP